MSLQVQCVQSANAVVGESPVWDSLRQALWWVDIRQRRILLYSPTLGQIGQWWMPSQVFSLNITTCNRLLVALEDGIYLFCPDNGELRRHGTLVHGPCTTRFNDGKVDPAGRLWIGTRDLEGSTPTGVLYRVHSDGSFEPQLTGVKGSNGLGWNADGSKFFYTDSRTKVIWSFDYVVETGELSRQQFFANLEGERGSPDGLSVDKDGCVWSVLFGGSCVIRFDSNGEEVERVPVPVPYPTSCAFGGSDMKTLFVTSESFALPADVLIAAPLSGALFAIETESVGVPVQPFAENRCRAGKLSAPVVIDIG
ncbi:SMP-30/gluconolactonase/LRE family protein [Paraburkholderia aspalathi]|uniref:SMP-30/gluconolactonase/LRE family protein n=1 Tax=Paraburkholderia aspalathi TaxID=1324617 RepID=UPI001B0F6FA8|nr:SMP-30/gluconolactonase/LRE family protein [Paraburkholderia aspalathi]CAE6738242.1 6-deoxy-6-sulfogluconolactonase [Paraburkholderia aspalathi]